MDKEDVIYSIYIIITQSLKKSELLPFATMWMNLEYTMLSKIS